MGQQQLLLLVMGVVLVGIAVVAGMHVFDAKMRQSTMDNLLDRNLSIATNAVVWKSKSDPYYGGDASYSDFTLHSTALKGTTASGRFEITRADGDDLWITAVSRRYPEIGVRTYVHAYDIDSTAVAYDGSITID